MSMSLEGSMCQDRDVLTHRYDAELRVYADAVRSLESAVGPGFAEASRRVDRALLAFRNARDQVSEHIRCHRCDAPG
jgi:hypothetical protein